MPKSALLLCFLGLTAGLMSGRADAQAEHRTYRIGVLNEAWSANHPAVEGLKAGLREQGFVEGRDIVLDVRFAKGDPEQLRIDAAELVKARVDLIFTSSAAATQAARAGTHTIPIVFTLVGDPVASGIVKTIARPGGNLTGISSLTTVLAAKRLEMLKTLAPSIERVWAIHYGADPASAAAVANAETAAAKLGVNLVARPVWTTADLDRALKEVRPGDALLPPDVGTLDIPAALLETSLSGGFPIVFTAALYVEHGGLASYGAEYRAQGIQAARLVAKILRGARPADLPVEGAEQIDVALNLKTATALALKVPRKALFRANLVLR
jgi:putative ABC transport system substrate-binding protein